MDTLEAILTRRSIRKYTNEPVSEEILETVIRAAMAAPSARNLQPWQFVLIQDRQTLNSVSDFHPYAQMLKEAPAAILVCGDLKLESNLEYCMVDCCAATQNLLLAAHAQGLGAVWLGMYPRPERIDGIQKLLALPDTIHPCALVAIGRPAESPENVDRFDSSRIHRDRW